MLSKKNYLSFIKVGYSTRELGFAFFRMKVLSWIWTRLKYPLRKRGRRVCIDYSVDIAGTRFIEIDDDCWIQRNTWITVPLVSMHDIENRTYLSIGKRVQVGRNCFIGASNNVTLADDVLLGPYVTIVDHTHQYSDETRPIIEQGITQEGFVKIGKGAWVGAGATVLGHRGLTIGENAVVAANTVLTKDLPANCVAIGNPARIMERRNEHR